MKLVEKYFAFRVKVGYTSWGKQITKMNGDSYVWENKKFSLVFSFNEVGRKYFAFRVKVELHKLG